MGALSPEPKPLNKTAETDIEFILRACLPTEWPAAQPEPRLVTGCLHPLEALKLNVNAMTGAQYVYCSTCLTVMTDQAINIRMDARHG